MIQEQALLSIRGAKENNLKDLQLSIPHYQLIVVTGVSGSGKSSLAFDIVAKEGQRRYLETFASFSRQFMGKLSRPEVEQIEGLSPVITLGQKTTSSNPRSTVGTLSDLYDQLRLLFARLGTSESNIELSRSLFSFNSPKGACPHCHGLGLEEKISLDKLIEDPAKTLREGALAPSLPNGYIMYSQVTIDVLNTVCEAHGFNVDIPWQNLTPEQQDVILNGSTRLKVPFGKHSLESRLKWTGITAKPREEGYYRGMLPIMSEILRRDRNKNILRYVESLTCSHCNGKRLNPNALSVQLKGRNIAELSAMEIRDLRQWLQDQSWNEKEASVALPVIEKMSRQISLLENLGVAHLSLDRPAASLSGGEAQRIRLVNQVSSELSRILYVFDEPSIGLHPSDHHQLLRILRMLVKQGNTVVVVEHDEATIRSADWIVDIGPGAGIEGGELLFNGPYEAFLGAKSLAGKSRTWDALQAKQDKSFLNDSIYSDEALSLKNCRVNNLKDISVDFLKGSFNAVTGIAGAGKSSLVHGVLVPTIEAHLANGPINSKLLSEISGHEDIDQLIVINQQPIGRTPRSNPATYIGLADRIRDLFAKTQEAQTAGFKKSRFSFNTKGGRCETCLGAGRIQIGMHLLGQVDVICGTCNGKRFNEETLKIQYKGKNIFEVFELSVREAMEFFKDQTAIHGPLKILADLGLGYIKLGQPSTTLSGGEAQRIKLASQLQVKSKGHTLYILDEPTTGLHMSDIQTLLKALRQLTENGHTVICIEHDPEMIRQADRVIDLGPGSGKDGGRVVLQGTPKELAESESVTGLALLEASSFQEDKQTTSPPDKIVLSGVYTHQLKHVNLTLPTQKLTVITGVSGSGKSSLAFDTLVKEAQSRFSESLSTYARSFLQNSNPARMESSSGLGPVIAIGRKYLNRSNRSTVATTTGLYDHYRLLFSRLSHQEGKSYSAQNFSFNHQSGACPACDGLGVNLTCDPEKLITHPHLSIREGALQGSKPGKFYGDVHGQYQAILQAVAEEHQLNLDLPWQELDERQKEIILYGTGDRVWEVTWEFRNKTRSGSQEVKAPWLGFCTYINDEYQRKQHNKNISALEALLHETTCPVCDGARLKPELLETRLKGLDIADLQELNIGQSLDFFEQDFITESPAVQAILSELKPRILDLLASIQQLGLSYLTASRRSDSLSGGEGQRLRLAGQLSGKLFGVTYVLDEPTIGLHESDTKALIQILRKLIAQGNTVVVVEHDLDIIRSADHLVEMGPGAGREGGHIIASGTPEHLMKDVNSQTGQLLRQPPQAEVVAHSFQTNAFGLVGAHHFNLNHLDIDFIAGGIIAVSGVSGSGKSTLINRVLVPSLHKSKPVGCEAIYGLERFQKVYAVNQDPVASNSLSSPATYTGLMDHLRNLFAAQPQAKEMSLKKNQFSYLHKDGRCPDCNGYGQQKTAMDFMSDVWSVCESCHGLRYRPEVLSVHYEGKNLGEMLLLTVDKALSFFSGQKNILPFLERLSEVGLGHLQLGQAGNTLSGGESQRLKLAKELIHLPKGEALFVFDEPSTGLHAKDILRLQQLFNRLASEKHTVLFIEHHPLLIGMANQVIELGPEGGPKGGKLLRSTLHHS